MSDPGDGETMALHEENDQLDNDNLLEEEAEEGGEEANNNEDQDGSAVSGTGDDLSMGDDADLQAIKARVQEMEEEAEKIRQMQTEVEKQMNMSGSSAGGTAGSPMNLSAEEKKEVDDRSVYVGNVDYGATAEELEAHFHGCGSINRVTILCDKFTGHPKGFAYIEFAEKESVQTSMALDESLFRGRQIKVNPKRTNKPGLSTTNRGRGGRGRGRVIVKYVYAPFRGGRGRGMYNRRRSFYSPY